MTTRPAVAIEELKMLSGFAVDDSTAFIVAVHPGEWAQPNHSTFVFRVRADGAQFVQTIARPLQRCWLSRHGVVYFTGANGEVMSFDRGSSATEHVCARAEELDAIIGFSGATAADDVLIACGQVSIFVRQGGRWSEYQLPEDVGEIYRLHGLSADEVYVCTDVGLYLWNGTLLEEREGPDDEVADVFVRSPGELVAVGDGVHLWSEPRGWKRLKSPFGQHSVGLCQTGDALYIPSRSGVARLTGGELTKVTGLPSGQLVAVGHDVIAAGRDSGVAYFDGSRWTRLSQAPATPETP